MYDFIEDIGLEWRNHVEAVAYDTNSNFQKAFKEKRPHIQPICYYFNTIKNYDDKVVNKVCKDEQRRLHGKGNNEATKSLKKTKFILTSSRKTLQKKDADSVQGHGSAKGAVCSKHEISFKKPDMKNGMAGFSKSNWHPDYSRTDECHMSEEIISIMEMCYTTGNAHLL